MNANDADRLTDIVEAFVRDRDDLRAMALCGSWARGDARSDSDLDVLIVTQEPDKLRRNWNWIEELKFSNAGFRYVSHEIATYGAVWSAHLRLEPETELELSLADANWASIAPIDPGTRQVVRDGFKIVVDKDGVLRKLFHACS